MKTKLMASVLLLLAALPLHAGDEKAVAFLKRYGGSMNREDNLDPKSPIVLIFLAKNAVQDGDLQNLADLTELRALDLTNATITDEGMKHLKASTKLEWFAAGNTRLSDGTMKLFGECKGMKKLFVGHTRVTDAGVKELLKLEQLEVLELTTTAITEKCLDDLIKMKSLRTLDVGSQHFTDKDIQKLAALTNLRRLGISNSIHVTSDGIAKLRKAMPNCKVNEPPDPPAPPKPPAPKDGPLGMMFVPLPRGTFFMGWIGQKGSAKKMEIKEGFEIAVFTLTQGQWQELMGSNPSHFSRAGKGKDKVRDVKDDDLKLFPVESVTWYEAQAFLKKLNEQEKGKGYVYRLPTQVEWEYACRGGAASEEECSFHFYFDRPTNDLSSNQANFDGNNPYGKADKGPVLGRPTKVGSYQPNRLGLHDMHGNVSQWCADDNFIGDPARVVRGGCWDFVGSSCRAYQHHLYPPTDRHPHVGIRVVRTPVR